MLSNDFPAQFSLKAILKDLRYVEDLAGLLRRPLMLAGAAKDAYTLGLQAGLGEADFSAVYNALKARRDISEGLKTESEVRSQKSEIRQPDESEGDLDQ